MQQAGTENTKKPKHKKPWYRIRNLILFFVIVIGGILGWMLYECVSLMDAEANVTVNYRELHQEKVSKMTGVAIEDAHETWDDLVLILDDAYAILRQIDRDIVAEDSEPRWEGDGPYLDFKMFVKGPHIRDGMDRERNAVKALQDAGTFDLLDEFVKKTIALDSYRSNEMLIGQLLPELSQSRRLSQVLMARARIAIESNDISTAIQSYEQSLALSHTQGHRNSMISWLVAASIETITFEEITSALQETQFSEDNCRRLINILKLRAIPPVEFALDSELEMLLDFVQWCYSDDGNGNGYFLPDHFKQLAMFGISNYSGLPGFPGAILSRFSMANRKETVEVFSNYIDGLIELSKMYPVQRGTKLKEWKSKNDIEFDKERHALIAEIMPSLVTVIQSDVQKRVQRDGTRLMVAIELFKAMNGRPPDTLDELVPEILEKLPVDFTHGGPFIYRVLEEPDQYGRIYLLYSTGLDQQDDGGHYVSDNDDYGYGAYIALQDPDATGVDFVINRPRPKWGE